MKITVYHPNYGKTELNTKRIIAICPEKRMVLFERVCWTLDKEDFEKVAKAFRSED